MGFWPIDGRYAEDWLCLAIGESERCTGFCDSAAFTSAEGRRVVHPNCSNLAAVVVGVNE